MSCDGNDIFHNKDFRTIARMSAGVSFWPPLFPIIEEPLTEPVFRDKLGLIDSLIDGKKKKKEEMWTKVAYFDCLPDDEIFITAEECSIITREQMEKVMQILKNRDY